MIPRLIAVAAATVVALYIATTQGLPASALLAIAAAASAWMWVMIHSYRTYPLRACRGCKGSGKDFEPIWMMMLRLSKELHFRNCPACGGSPKIEVSPWE